MFPEQLKKILNLIKQTGDRVVLFDANKPDESYVVMDFDKYAEMSGVSEDGKSINKPVNHTPEAPKEAPKQEMNNPVPPLMETVNKSTTENLTEEDLTDKINREISMWKNRDDLTFSGGENKPKKAWAIPPQVKDKASEVEN